MPSSRDLSTRTLTKKSRTRTACDSCRTCRTKCDGAKPCGTCCRSRSKRAKPCKYSQKSDESVALVNEGMIPDSLLLSTCNQLLSPSGPQMHHRFSLYRVVDDFVGFEPRKGRVGRHIEKIQRLFSSVPEAVSNYTALTMPHSIKIPPHCLHAVGQASPEQDVSSQTSEQNSVRERLVIWQAYLDTGIEQEMKRGRFTKAWTSVAIAMRGLEVIDVQSGLIISDTEELQNQMQSMCLKLVEWDCILSFLIGVSSHVPSWSEGRFLSATIKQHKLDNHSFASRLDLCHEIQGIYEIDTRRDEGLCKLLQRVIELQRPQDDGEPVNKILKIATSLVVEDSVEMQESHLIANVVLLMLYSRTASICAYYRGNMPHSISERLLSLLEQGEIQPQSLRSRIIKYAATALDSFGHLYQLDSEGTTNSWIRLHSVLVAAVVGAIADLKTIGPRKDLVKQQICHLQHCFEEMRCSSNCSPFIEKGIAILRQCLEDKALPDLGADIKKTSTRSRKRYKASSSSKEGCTPSQGSTFEEADSRDGYVTDVLDEIHETTGCGLFHNIKRQRLVDISTPAKDTLLSDEQDVGFDSSWSTYSSFTTACEYPTSEQSIEQCPVEMSMDPDSSFTSNNSIPVVHSPMANCYTLDHFVDPLAYELQSLPYTLWPEWPPIQVWQSPHPSWPGEYFTFDQRYAMELANASANVLGRITCQQQYLSQAVQMIPQFQTPAPAPASDSFGQYSTSSMEALEPAVTLFESDVTTSFPCTIQFDMGQVSSLDMGLLSCPAQVQQQGFGEYHATDSIHAHGKEFDEEE